MSIRKDDIVSKRGGKRKGAGRKPEGKRGYSVTLTEKNVKRAKKREPLLSPLLDRLLGEWLG
jgi:hypothetical protein